MKKLLSVLFIAIFISAVLTSCSKNSFQTRRNYQPRVKVEAKQTVRSEDQGLVVNHIPPQNIPIQTNSKIPQKHQHLKLKKVSRTTVKGETFVEKLATIFVPKKKELLRPIFHPEKNILKTAKTKDDRIAGLVINLLALVFAIIGLLMIIGMAHGNVWVCFVVAMVFACAAIVMGFVGRMLAFKGIGLLAGILGILAVMAILIFLLLITVVGIVF